MMMFLRQDPAAAGIVIPSTTHTLDVAHNIDKMNGVVVGEEEEGSGVE